MERFERMGGYEPPKMEWMPVQTGQSFATPVSGAIEGMDLDGFYL